MINTVNISYLLNSRPCNENSLKINISDDSELNPYSYNLYHLTVYTLLYITLHEELLLMTTASNQMLLNQLTREKGGRGKKELL